jgi:hypothetical protein
MSSAPADLDCPKRLTTIKASCSETGTKNKNSEGDEIDEMVWKFTGLTENVLK